MGMRRIKVLDLIPVFMTKEIGSAVKDRKDYADLLSRDTNGLVELGVKALEKGTASIEGVYDEIVDAPYILLETVRAEMEGYDAVVIDCFGDPALDAARELVSIPVVGANIAASHLAAQIAGRYSVINILPETEPIIRALTRKYGLEGSLASVRTINVPVLDLEGKMDVVVESAVREAEAAYTRDGAYAIVLGCTGMSALADRIGAGLEGLGIHMPVIEPLRAAIATAVSMVIQGISHSKLAYPRPRAKPRRADFELPF